MRRGALFRPVERASHRLVPLPQVASGVLFPHLGREHLVHVPLFLQFVDVFPITDGQPRQIGGAERRRLQYPRANHGATADVRLELHQEIVGYRPAVHADFSRPRVDVVLHRLQHVVHLVANAFQGGAGDVGRRGAARDADDGPAGVLIPVGSAQTGQRGDEVDASVVRHGAGDPRTSNTELPVWVTGSCNVLYMDGHAIGVKSRQLMPGASEGAQRAYALSCSDPKYCGYDRAQGQVLYYE